MEGKIKIYYNFQSQDCLSPKKKNFLRNIVPKIKILFSSSDYSYPSKISILIFHEWRKANGSFLFSPSPQRRI